MSKVVPEYAPISQNKTKQKKTTKSATPLPPTAQRELELQCSKESSGKGSRSEEFIQELRANQASEPNNQAVSPRGHLSFSGRKLTQQAGVEVGERFITPFRRSSKLSNSLAPCFWPLRPNHQGPLPGGDLRARPGNEIYPPVGSESQKHYRVRDFGDLDLALPGRWGRVELGRQGHQVTVDLNPRNSYERKFSTSYFNHLLPASSALLSSKETILQQPEKSPRLQRCGRRWYGGGRGWKWLNHCVSIWAIESLGTSASDAPRK